MFFHEGRLRAVDRNGIILVSTHFSDAALNEPQFLGIPNVSELLPVQQHGCCGCYGSYELKNVDFKVYKITEEQKGSEERKLGPVNDLGDWILFVVKGCSTSWSGSASTFFIKNCIYFWSTDSVGRFHLLGDVGNAVVLSPKVLEKHRFVGHCYWNCVWITPRHPTTLYKRAAFILLSKLDLTFSSLFL